MATWKKKNTPKTPSDAEAAVREGAIIETAFQIMVAQILIGLASAMIRPPYQRTYINDAG